MNILLISKLLVGFANVELLIKVHCVIQKYNTILVPPIWSIIYKLNRKTQSTMDINLNSNHTREQRTWSCIKQTTYNPQKKTTINTTLLIISYKLLLFIVIFKHHVLALHNYEEKHLKCNFAFTLPLINTFCIISNFTYTVRDTKRVCYIINNVLWIIYFRFS